MRQDEEIALFQHVKPEPESDEEAKEGAKKKVCLISPISRAMLSSYISSY